MPPVKESTVQQYDQIRKDFEKENVMEFGVHKFTPEYLFAKLAQRYFKKPTTIEKIIFHRV